MTHPTRWTGTIGRAHPDHPEYGLNPRLNEADETNGECCDRRVRDLSERLAAALEREQRMLGSLAAHTGKPVGALRVEFGA